MKTISVTADFFNVSRGLTRTIKTPAMTWGQTCNTRTQAQKLVSNQFVIKVFLPPYTDCPWILDYLNLKNKCYERISEHLNIFILI